MKTPQRDRSYASVVVDAMGEVAPQIAAPSEKTLLFGENAVLDSVAFITLLVAIEQRLDGRVDLSTAFLELGATPGDANPFRTVASLARHLETMAGG